MNQPIMDQAKAEAQRQAAHAVATELAAARYQFAQLQAGAPAMTAGLKASTAHAAQVNAATARLQQLEAAYSQAFGAAPAQLEQMGVVGFRT